MGTLEGRVALITGDAARGKAAGAPMSPTPGLRANDRIVSFHTRKSAGLKVEHGFCAIDADVAASRQLKDGQSGTGDGSRDQWT